MREYLVNVFRKVIKKNKIGFSDYFAVATLVLVLILSITFKFNFKFNELTDSRLFAAYDTPSPVVPTTAPTAVPTAVPTVTYNCPGRCSNSYGCKRANAYTSSTADCNSPIGTVNYSPDCSCNFNKDDPYCIANCPCQNCTVDDSVFNLFSSDPCIATRNYPPIFGGLVIKNDSGGEVLVEAGDRNQICQTSFNRSRSITFEVTASDQDGITDITSGGSVTLTWNGKTVPYLGYVGDGSKTGVFTFGTTFPDDGWNNASVYPLKVVVTDSMDSTVSDSYRNFKIWDCQIPVSGAIYDATEASTPYCPTNGFGKLSDASILNFQSLTFQNDAGNKNMTVNPDGISYDSGSNGLTWGVDNYIPKFNDKISLSDGAIRVNGNCPSWVIDTSVVDPYVSAPTIIADFSGILDQNPWWQAVGGGVVSNSQINGHIPVTCTFNCKISIGGLVSSPKVINDTNKSLSDAQGWYYGATGSDNSNTNAKLANVNTNYSYFYNQFFVKKGVGTTFVGNKTITSLTDLGSDTNNIYFINGDLITAGDIITTNKFLMIIVSGNITVTQDTKRVDGVLVANNIYASGDSDNQLNFNGSLFAFNNVEFSRNYTDKLINNSTPAVVVNYNPGLMFNMPGSVAKILTNWQWGN